MEESVGLSSASSRGERLLPVQVDLRGGASGSQSRRAGSRSTRRVQRLESYDRSWQIRVLQHWAVTSLSLGSVARSFRFMHQRLTPPPSDIPPTIPSRCCARASLAPTTSAAAAKAHTSPLGPGPVRRLAMDRRIIVSLRPHAVARKSVGDFSDRGHHRRPRYALPEHCPLGYKRSEPRRGSACQSDKMKS